MFNDKLTTRPYQTNAINAVKEQPMTQITERTDITWIREERNDIDYKGYRNYLYEFKNPSAEDKEIGHCVIAASTMDAAIQLFVDQIRGPDWYPDAEINVEVIGIDIRKEGSTPWVMSDY